MQCPECKNTVPVSEAHYGALYTCPKCSAVYFINFEGLPEYGDMQMATDHLQDVSQNEIVNPTESSLSSLQNDQFAQSDVHQDLGSDLNNNFQGFESLQNLENEISQFTEVPTEAGSFGGQFDSVAQEITDYGNQEEVISQISYDLTIQGLDSKELMSQFVEAIEDQKFGWMVQDLLARLKNGEITLKNLNPIQAYVLAQRIYFLDLEMKWTQHVAF